MDHAISWFEIPSIDLERATEFYENVFDLILIPIDTPQIKMRLFPVEDATTNIGGAIVHSNGFHVPSATDGPLI